jgi:hypothetical protein
MFGDGRWSPPSRLSLTLRLSSSEAPERPTLRATGGWLAGDLHVHTGHNDGYHIDRAGRRLPIFVNQLAELASSVPLDFLAVTDHNTASHWVDVDRTQLAYPDLLLLHGREITTSQGHFNAIGERAPTDSRLGPKRPIRQLMADAANQGAFISINHPWLQSDEWCQGCGWADRSPETVEGADGVEIVNGSTPTGSHLPGWAWWADQLNRGAHLVAVGGSDVHDPLDGRAAVGAPSTVVWAQALSEQALVAGLRSGRAFVRLLATDRSSVDIQAQNGLARASMGGTIPFGPLQLRAVIAHAAGQRCNWIRRGAVIRSTPITSDAWTGSLLVDAGPGDWFSVIVTDAHEPRLISNAVYLVPGCARAPCSPTSRRTAFWDPF